MVIAESPIESPIESRLRECEDYVEGPPSCLYETIGAANPPAITSDQYSVSVSRPNASEQESVIHEHNASTFEDDISLGDNRVALCPAESAGEVDGHDRTEGVPESSNVDVAHTEAEIVEIPSNESQGVSHETSEVNNCSELEQSFDRLSDKEDYAAEELEFTIDHFADSDDSTFPYEEEYLSTSRCTPMGRETNLPTTSTANRAPDTLLRRISSRSTKGKPPEKLTL